MERKLTGSLSSAGTLTGAIRRSSSPVPIPYYTGEYEVTPQTYEQKLETAGLRMSDDVTVFEVPYYETTNPSGGYTVIIGG